MREDDQEMSDDGTDGGRRETLSYMTDRTFSAVLFKEKDLYVAECPEVRTVSQGPSIEEALANLKEATELYLEEFPLSEGEKPFEGLKRREPSS